MRLACVSETRQWIKFYPDKFLINDLVQIIIGSIKDEVSIIKKRLGIYFKTYFSSTNLYVYGYYMFLCLFWIRLIIKLL